jgi:hypothetical protein
MVCMQEFSRWVIVSYDILVPWLIQGWPKDKVGNFRFMTSFCFIQAKQRAWHHAIDKVTKRLGIKVATYQGKDVTSMVHYSAKGKLIGGGINSWLIALQGYALKLKSCHWQHKKQPTKELEAIKKTLEISFEYLDHPLAYKYVKDQIIVVLKSRQVYLKKKKTWWRSTMELWRASLEPSERNVGSRWDVERVI